MKRRRERPGFSMQEIAEAQVRLAEAGLIEAFRDGKKLKPAELLTLDPDEVITWRVVSPEDLSK